MPFEPDYNWGMSMGGVAYNTIEAILTHETQNKASPFQALAPLPLVPRVNHIVHYLQDHYNADLTPVDVHWSVTASFTQLVQWLQLNSPFDKYVWPYAKLGMATRMKREAENPIGAPCIDRLPAVLSIFSDDPRW